MSTCFFATDLHGHTERYEKLFRAVQARSPRAVFLGGDLMPHFSLSQGAPADFLGDFVGPRLEALRSAMGSRYPTIFVILGNDDYRVDEEAVLEVQKRGLWEYAHFRRTELEGYPVYGYAFVPPTPFLLKDWEKYDVSRYTPPGSVSPEEGRRSVRVDRREVRHATIWNDLQQLAGGDDLTGAILLFHSPPNETNLDRAALDGKMIDHVPLDLHVGSIAVRRFIEMKQPLITLHGHIHESTRLTGSWHDRIGRTFMVNGSHDGEELSLITFDPGEPENTTRELL
ncbi:MAG: hypothetical protein PVF33_05770 [Candidatus Latescibacterota bacterium]|jgi:Icc-related predicted phosphoesterase